MPLPSDTPGRGWQPCLGQWASGLGLLLLSILPAHASDACQWDAPWPEAPPAHLLHTDDPLAQALVDEWEEGANFACSARLVTLGCGTGCVSGAIYDAATQAWQPLGFAVHRDLHQEAPMLRFVTQSCELLVEGILNEEEAVRRLYRWDGQRLAADDSSLSD